MLVILMRRMKMKRTRRRIVIEISGGFDLVLCRVHEVTALIDTQQ